MIVSKDNIIKEKNWFVAIILVIFLCLFAYTKNTIYMYFLFGGGILLIPHPELLFPMVFVSSLSSYVFAIEDGFSVGRYISLIFIISCLLCYISDRRKDKYNNIVVIGIVVLFSFLSTVLGLDGELEPFIQMLINLLVFLLFGRIYKYDFNKLMFYVSLASLIAIVLLGFIAFRDGAFLMADRFDLDGKGNANNLAMMMEQCGAICFAYILFGKNNYFRLLYLFGVVATLWLIVFTGSRSALIGLMAAMLACFWIKFKNIKRGNRLGSILIIAIVLFVGYVFIKDVSSMDNSVISRFSIEDIADSGGAGRKGIAKTIMTKIFPDHFLFGSGLGTSNMAKLAAPYNLDYPAAHNIIIDPLAQLGIVGFSLYLLILVPVIKKTIYLFKSENVSYIMPIALVVAATVNGIGEIVFYEKFFWNDLTLIVLAYQSCRNTIDSKYVVC